MLKFFPLILVVKTYLTRKIKHKIKIQVNIFPLHKKVAYITWTMIKMINSTFNFTSLLDHKKHTKKNEDYASVSSAVRGGIILNLISKTRKAESSQSLWMIQIV